MRTAIIDYGIDIHTQELFNDNIEYYEVRNNKVVPSKPLTDITHGGICAGVFATYARKMPDISICLNKDDMQRSNSNDLATAISWCADNDVELISLSMGTTKYYDTSSLQSAMQKADASGIILIAAASNSGLITYPAVYDSCIGVSCYDGLEKGEIAYIKNPYDGIDIVTHSTETPHTNALGSNSLSAAYIAGIVCAEFKNKPKPDDVRKYLATKSIKMNKKQEAHFLQDKIKYNPECDPVIIAFSADSNVDLTQFINDLHKHITDDLYVCAVISQNNINNPADLHFSLDKSPVLPKETLNLTIKTCNPDVILTESRELIECADVIINYDNNTVNLSELCTIELHPLSPCDIWNKIKKHYE